MPGLIATRAKYSEDQPLKGARIAGCLHMSKIETKRNMEFLGLTPSSSHPNCRPNRNPHNLGSRGDLDEVCGSLGLENVQI